MTKRALNEITIGKVVKKNKKISRRPKVMVPSTTFAKKVRAVVNPELKEFAFDWNQAPPAAGGSIQCINQIAQGTDMTNRIGRHVDMKSLEIIYFVVSPTTAYYDLLTWWLVYDRQPDGNLPNVGDILDLTPGQPTVLSFMNTRSNRDRFTLLRTETAFASNSVASQRGTGQQSNFFQKIHVNLKDTDCEFNGTATTYPNSGALYLVFASLTNSGTASADASISFNTKLIFTDM